jgi:hypothetical protein
MDLYILMAAVTLMNLLIGVLCEVVGAIGAAEKEELALSYAKTRLQGVYDVVIGKYKENGELRTISKEEFVTMLENVEACRAMDDLGVDVAGLVDFAEVIFATDHNDDEYELLISFPDFLDMVTQLRGCNVATVKDIVDLRKYVGQSNAKFEKILESLGMSQAKRLGQLHQGLNKKMSKNLQDIFSSISTPMSSLQLRPQVESSSRDHLHLAEGSSGLPTEGLSDCGPPPLNTYVSGPEMMLPRTSQAVSSPRALRGGFVEVPAATLQTFQLRLDTVGEIQDGILHDRRQRCC